MHKLRALREARGMTQTELGRRIRISPSAISAVEAGDRRPWRNFRKRVAKVFGVEESEIFGGDTNES